MHFNFIEIHVVFRMFCFRLDLDEDVLDTGCHMTIYDVISFFTVLYPRACAHVQQMFMILYTHVWTYHCLQMVLLQVFLELNRAGDVVAMERYFLNGRAHAIFLRRCDMGQLCIHTCVELLFGVSTHTHTHIHARPIPQSQNRFMPNEQIE